MTVSRIQLTDNGPEFSRLVAGVWRLGEWGMDRRGLLNFIHQTQRSGKWIGEGDPHGGQSLGESVGQEVQNVSAPGEPAAIAAGLA